MLNGQTPDIEEITYRGDDVVLHHISLIELKRGDRVQVLTIKLPYTPIASPIIKNVNATWYIPSPKTLGHKPKIGPAESSTASAKGRMSTLTIGKSSFLVR